MIVPSGSLVREWRDLIAARDSIQGPVLVFVALPDCDAIATATTIMALLKSELVTYEVLPVSNYSEMVVCFRDIASTANPRGALFINCGARVDLEKLLDVESLGDKGLPLLVLDCSRPYHINNIESDRVRLLHDSTDLPDQYRLPVGGFEDQYGFVHLDSDSDSGVTSEDERRDIAEDDVVFGPGFGSEEEDGEQTEPQPALDGDEPAKRRRKPKRGRPKKRARAPREKTDDMENRKKLAEMRLEAYEYYSRCHTATCSALMAYMLVLDLNRASSSSLWMAMVGIADHLVFHKATIDTYNDNAKLLRGQLQRFNPDAKTGAHSTVWPLSSLDDAEAIQGVREPRLELLRHWTLYDSMLNSEYICSKMGAWRQVGRNDVLQLLAKLGVPIRVAQQRWQHLPQDRKSALEDDESQTVMDGFGLHDFHYDGFLKTRGGYQNSISAADVVLAVAATLELKRADALEAAGADKTVWQELFWRSYDVVCAPLGHPKLSKALTLGIQSQKLVVQIGGQVIDRKNYVSAGPFRYTFLRDGLVGKAMQRQLIATRVALFLMEAIAAHGARPKPFLVMSPLEEKGAWLAVAVTSPELYNDFGSRFRKAAAKNGTQIVAHGFTSSAVEVPNGQEIEFVRLLHDLA